ncbi:fusaric acid resistance protein-like [Terrimicrobium sacchariphilum]|uniref:Fusaric acid resistance protein-like n=1 Tax=Terrimicrobium sacchariphilum TaxID=690879 RepID=A0A146G2T8_TERSA|nr:FUSC family protein [Terrimicrobium sacchariphilum]GAT32155.1 fusaric acid resistance protein-like [Terrimicrobium sacchariphilum]
MEILKKLGERYVRGSWFDVVAVLAGSLVLGVGFWSLGRQDPMWAIIAFVLVYEPGEGEVLDHALTRLCWTVIGSVLAVAALTLGGVQKWVLPASLAIAMMLGIFFTPSLAARRVLLVTVALIVGSTLMQPSSDLFIAITRSVEVAVGSFLAVGVSAVSVRWVRRGGPRQRKRFLEK